MHPAILRYRTWFTRPVATDTALTALRIIIGALLVYHGQGKMFGGLTGLANGLAENGWPLPHVQAVMAAVIEFGGGILLVVGLFTRPIALMNVVLFTIITFVHHGADPFKAQEKAFLFLVICAVVACAGPGRFSVDQQIFGRKDADRIA